MQIEYKKRRNKLMNMVGDDGIIIIPTAPMKIRNRDVAYPFRPDSDFYYLTGYSEPSAVAVLMPNRSQGEYILFCLDRDEEKEIWDGVRVGVEGVCDHYMADDAFPIEDIDEILPNLMENRSHIYYNMGHDANLDKRIIDWNRHNHAATHVPNTIISLNHFLHDMRLYKSREEIKLMRRAAKISANAHRRAMQVCAPDQYEYQLSAEIYHEFMINGAQAAAYPNIVGGGKNSCILHYIDNHDLLRDGDIVLIDAGAEYQGYASDISRTFPVNGRFSKAQKAVYEIVLAAQKAAIDEVKPGNHWNDPHEAAVRVITEGLLDLGILKGKLSQLIKKQAYKPYYMHRTSHWIGMDVHDVGDYKLAGRWRLLEPNMAMTMEPGIYLSSKQKGLAKTWHDIGVRIEDDIVVTKAGCDVLTKNAPKEVDDIEALMNG